MLSNSIKKCRVFFEFIYFFTLNSFKKKKYSHGKLYVFDGQETKVKKGGVF